MATLLPLGGRIPRITQIFLKGSRRNRRNRRNRIRFDVDMMKKKNNENTTHDVCGLRPNVLFFRPCA